MLTISQELYRLGDLLSQISVIVRNIQMRTNSMEASRFPDHICWWSPAREKTKALANIPFAGLKRFVSGLQEGRRFHVIEIAPYLSGIKYFFADFTISFIPTNRHYGNVTFHGLDVNVRCKSDELLTFIRYFDVKWCSSNTNSGIIQTLPVIPHWIFNYWYLISSYTP